MDARAERPCCFPPLLSVPRLSGNGNAGKIEFEYFFIVKALLGHRIGAPLAHAYAVAPAGALKRIARGIRNGSLLFRVLGSADQNRFAFRIVESEGVQLSTAVVPGAAISPPTV